MIDWNAGNAFRFVIVSKTEIVGGIGLEQKNPSLFELGYWIARQHWGKGFATEAVFAVINFSQDQLTVLGITATCHEENQRSQKVLLKNNFFRVGTRFEFSTSLGKKVPGIQFFWNPTVSDRPL
jgi:RimJ/RimL family protein N-acetyltransferase